MNRTSNPKTVIAEIYDDKDNFVADFSTNIEMKVGTGYVWFWSNLIAISDLKGANGVGIANITKTGTVGLVDTYTITYTDSTASTFDVTNGDDGTDGRDLELQKSLTHIQWRYVGDSTWIDLVALSDINGNDGREVELQNNGTYIQWRYTGGTWTNLVAISGLKGDNGLGFTQITETSRIALTPSNNLPYWQTDGAIGSYYWRDGAWSFLGAKKKKTIATSTYTVNPIIDVGYLLEFTNDCVVSVPNGSIASGNTIDMISASGKTITLQNSGTMELSNVIPTQSLVSVIQETIVSVMYTSSNKGLVAGGLM